MFSYYFKLGLRSLRRNPALTALMVLTLAIGVAASVSTLAILHKSERLPQILATIEERTRHLEGFILGYARFAKLPTPRIEACGWDPFLAQLSSQVQFALIGEAPRQPALVDPAQMEQALLNLLKNAHESGSRPDQVELHIKRMLDVLRIEVMDRGQGMNDAVLTNALVPFYSTKRSGTGLGLALARDRRGARRPHHPRQPRRRRPDRHPDPAGRRTGLAGTSAASRRTSASLSAAGTCA